MHHNPIKLTCPDLIRRGAVALAPMLAALTGACGDYAAYDGGSATGAASGYGDYEPPPQGEAPLPPSDDVAADDGDAQACDESSPVTLFLSPDDSNSHARKTLDDLESYYWTAVKQNYCKSYQRNPLRECPVYDDGNYRCDTAVSFGDPTRLDVVLDLRRRLCRLGPQDREIVLRTFQGENSKEIARALKMTDANVRQRLKRALERIGDA
jgi:hypothetical protein